VSKEGIHLKHFVSQCGCDSTVILDLKVIPDIQGEIAHSLINCYTHEYQFYAILEIPQGVSIKTSQWTFPEDYVETNKTSVTYQFKDSGSFEVNYRVLTQEDCENSYTDTVHVPYYNEDFEIIYDPAYIVDKESRINFKVDMPEYMIYEWDFGDGNTAYENPTSHIFTPDKHTESYDITLTVNNPDDCPVSKTATIDVYLTINPPNTFSPNSDGINDVFMPQYKVKIVNRNGVIIFEGDDGWDGTYKGKDAPEDTYFYQVFYEMPTGIESKKGYITIIR
jgi:gliding motility-associated-like protein